MTQLNNAEQRKTIDSIMTKNYVLFTYHNPIFKSSIKNLDNNSFENLILTRLSTISEFLTDSLIITPTEGCYNNKQEPSFMISFGLLSLADQLNIISVFTGLANDLGQESFIFRVCQAQGLVTDEHNLMVGRKGEVIAQGQGVTLIKSKKTDYTLINNVKFSLTFQAWA